MIDFRMSQARLLLGIVLLTAGNMALAAESCTDGTAGGFACSHMELIANLAADEMGGPGEPLSDIWGWTDPVTGEEYAIVGMYDGTAFVRLSDDGSGTPTFVGRLRPTDGMAPVTRKPGATQQSACHDDCEGEEGASTWRDVKVLGNYALVVSEADGHGMQVFDLTRLRSIASAPQNEFIEDAHYREIGHAHNVVVNEAYDRAYIVGSGSRALGEGGLHIVDLSDPVNPSFLAAVNGDGYTHDAQCVAYAGPSSSIPQGNDICFAANEDSLTIWDVTNPQSPVMLSKSTYSNTAYTHQVWLSEDHRYAYLNDELDEQGVGFRTNTRIFDVSDPANPVFVKEYLAPTWSIDHNNYVNGRFLYQSNYLAGLRILDIGDPENPVEAAYFDISSADSASFSGSWSNYPYFDSGKIIISDMNQGLFVLRSELQTAASQADLTVNATVDAVDGDVAPFRVSVENQGSVGVDDVLVQVHTPRSGTLGVAIPPNGWECDVNRSLVECRGDSMAAGESVELAFIGQGDGRAVDVEMIASTYARQLDIAPTDNRKVTNLSLPAYETGGSGSGGSGGDEGGGAPGWPLLLATAFLAALRRR